MRPIEQPVIREEAGPGGLPETRTTHPAYAQIGASRVSGGCALYGSDFAHNAYMTITIRPSEVRRNLSNDWYSGGRGKLIEIAMSESQWATFVSAPNVGEGVPCTLQQFNGQITPGLPDPANRAAQFGAEMRKRIQDSVDELNKAAEDLEALGLPKGKTAAAKEALRRAESALGNSMVFIADQFDEHMEKTVEKAKAEIHGYMNGALVRTGIAALTGGEMPLQIEAPKP